MYYYYINLYVLAFWDWLVVLSNCWRQGHFEMSWTCWEFILWPLLLCRAWDASWCWHLCNCSVTEHWGPLSQPTTVHNLTTNTTAITPTTAASQQMYTPHSGHILLLLDLYSMFEAASSMQHVWRAFEQCRVFHASRVAGVCYAGCSTHHVWRVCELYINNLLYNKMTFLLQTMKS